MHYIAVEEDDDDDDDYESALENDDANATEQEDLANDPDWLPHEERDKSDEAPFHHSRTSLTNLW